MDPLTTVDRFYAAFGAGDPQMLTGFVTDDFRIEIPVLEHLPLRPVYEGVAGFEQLLRDRDAGQIVYDEFERTGVIAQDDAVAVTGRTAGRALAAQRPFGHEWVHIFRFADGRVATFKEYLDSSSVSAACAP